MTDRTVFPVVGFMGAVQAGCCYVPVDVKMPIDRMKSILTQVAPAAILYAKKDEKVASQFSGLAPLIKISLESDTVFDLNELQARRDGVLDIDPLYTIFTSGSTGKPKGILISHRNVIDFIEWMDDTCGLDENDVLANQAPFYFDLSVKNLYTALKCGATVHILPQKFFSFPKLLSAYLNEHSVTALIWATSAFRIIATSGILEREPFRSVKKVILGGEALQASHLNLWRKAMPDTMYINLYGPTEVTVDCTYFPITREYRDDEIIPIGKACKNMEVMLIDDDDRLAVPGKQGEICVRGTGLAIGYLGDDEKNAVAFVQNPLNPRYPDRLYRTGDLGRLDEDGNIIFVSRKDHQIKHMGYRIELGEVETAVCAIDGVSDAVCIFDEDEDEIVCFCVTEMTAAQLVATAKTRIPKYMIPGVWKIMESLPANANGKNDRVKLKENYLAER